MKSHPLVFFVIGLVLGGVGGSFVGHYQLTNSHSGGARDSGVSNSEGQVPLQFNRSTVRTGTAFRSANQTNDQERTDQALNERALGRLYLSASSLRVLTDIRVILALSSNDVASAKRLLILEMDRNVSSLSGLSREVELSEFDKKALRQGQQFFWEITNQSHTINAGGVVPSDNLK